MTKRQLIDEIVTVNPTAQPEFLAPFEDEDLSAYLAHLLEARKPRLLGDPRRFDKYFAAPAARPAKVSQAPAAPAVAAAPIAISDQTEAAERAALLAKEPPPAEPELEDETANAPLAADPNEQVPAAISERDAETKDDTEVVPGAKASPVAEGPTTRRESLSARVARAWRPSPSPPEPQESEPELDSPRYVDEDSDVPPTDEADDVAPSDKPEAAETDEVQPAGTDSSESESVGADSPAEPDSTETPEPAVAHAIAAVSTPAASQPGDDETPSWLF